MSASGNDQANALIIVAKYPEPGHVKTRLGAVIGAERAATLYSAFLRDLAERFEMSEATAATEASWTLRWAVTPSDRPVESLREYIGAAARVFAQRGDDFAERLYHICVDVCALGAQRIVIMSSDAPQLPTALAMDAFAALHTYDVAISPAEDGGYSLIALRLPDPTTAPLDLFRGIQMSTPTVMKETFARAASLGLRVRLLATTFDVDEAADLERLWRALYAAPDLAPNTLAALSRLTSLANLSATAPSGLAGITSITSITSITGNEDEHDGIVSRR
jgi:rSAM/selenodomain-associated transferase 1